MSRKIANTLDDPTLPITPVEIGGKIYHLCFTYGALSTAQRKMREAGRNVNMLFVLDVRNLDAETLPIVFFAALIMLQPEMTFEGALALLTLDNWQLVYGAIVEAYELSLPKSTARPTEPGAENRPDGSISGPSLESPSA